MKKNIGLHESKLMKSWNKTKKNVAIFKPCCICLTTNFAVLRFQNNIPTTLAFLIILAAKEFCGTNITI